MKLEGHALQGATCFRPSNFICADFPAILTCETLKSRITPEFLSRNVYVWYLALQPRESHLPSPSKSMYPFSTALSIINYLLVACTLWIARSKYFFWIALKGVWLIFINENIYDLHKFFDTLKSITCEKNYSRQKKYSQQLSQIDLVVSTTLSRDFFLKEV